VGEAMCCGIPCAVTGAGNSAEIVGDTGSVVPVGDPVKLAAQVVELLDLPEQRRRELGRAARRRVERRWSIDATVASYAAYWTDTIAARPRR